MEILNWSLHIISGQVSTFGLTCRLCPRTTTWPDTWDENQLQISSYVGVFYEAVVLGFLE